MHDLSNHLKVKVNTFVQTGSNKQGSRLKFCVLLFENAVGGSTGWVSDCTIPIQTSNNQLSIKEHTHSTDFYSLPSE